MTLNEYKAVLAFQHAIHPSMHPCYYLRAGFDVLEQLLYKYWTELGLPKQLSIAEAIRDYNAIPNVLNLALDDLSEEDQFTYMLVAGYPE